MPTHVIVAPQRAVVSSVALARDVLGVAASEAAARGAGATRVLLASETGESVRCWNGLVLPVDCGIGDIDSCDLVWVAGFWGPPARGLSENAAVVAWLARKRSEGALVAVHGPATFLAAEAGILDGRLATTYVEHADDFRVRYPDVNLQLSRLLTDGGGVFCCIGMNSGADLLVTLIERLYGSGIAASIAQWALVDSQRNYQGAMMVFDGQKYHGDADVVAIQEWLERSFGDPVSIAELAKRFGMSARTLTRRFRAATGEAPSDYLAQVRVEIAKELLRQTQVTIAEVAARVGYRDVGAFYKMFERHAGMRPGTYREAQPLVSAARMADKHLASLNEHIH